MDARGRGRVADIKNGGVRRRCNVSVSRLVLRRHQTRMSTFCALRVARLTPPTYRGALRPAFQTLYTRQQPAVRADCGMFSPFPHPSVWKKPHILPALGGGNAGIK